MRVIGLVGPIGAGKDVVSSYLQKSHGYKAVIMGDIVREIAAKHDMRPTRDNLHALQKRYTDKYGKGYFAEQTAKRVLRQWQVTGDLSLEIRAVINGIRRLEDASVPKKKFGKDMILLFIDSDKEKRFERLRSRKNERDPRTLEEFEQQEAAETRLFSIEALRAYADDVIVNNGSVEELCRRIDMVLLDRGFSKKVA